MMQFIDKIIDNIDIRSHWKVFVFNVVAIFAMVVLQHMNLKPPKLVSSLATFINPIPERIEESVKQVDVFDVILQKLQLKENTFQLNKPASLIPNAYSASTFDNLTSYAVVDLENGNLLYSKNLSGRAPVASITKIMTSVVALDLADPEELFTVSEKASEIIPTKIGVVPGEKMSLQELLNAALLTSANDAVEVIKEGINKKYQSNVFVRAMNAKAQILGLKNTQFQNPQGFDAVDHFSSSEDLIILSKYAMDNYPLINEIVKKSDEFLPNNINHKQFDLPNWNGLIGVYPGVYGVKNGQTGKAGKTNLVFSRRGDKNIGVVVLGASTILERDIVTADLLDMGFSKVSGLKPINVTETQLKYKYQSW